ncbi:MAG: ClpXP protease specificity-enhancing factor SspB [Pseudomonadota bacterium]
MTDFIGYERLTQAALRGVVREALRSVRDNGGMLGDHHFYITFLTRAPGVKMADHLVEQFPNDMTIVIQHQYWDLEVHEKHFEVVLKFNGVPQHLHIPYQAVARFVDPSLNFGLTFQNGGGGDNDVIGPLDEFDKAEAEMDDAEEIAPEGTVVNLDAFRKR